MQAGGAHRADGERRRSPLWMELFAPAVGRVDADVTFGAQSRQPRSRCRRTTRRYAGLGRSSGARPLEDSVVLRAPSAVGALCAALATRALVRPTSRSMAYRNGGLKRIVIDCATPSALAQYPSRPTSAADVVDERAAMARSHATASTLAATSSRPRRRGRAAPRSTARDAGTPRSRPGASAAAWTPRRPALPPARPTPTAP